MSHQVVKVRREAVAPCMTCPLCHRLFHKATTIIECLHTFCRRCIYNKLNDEEMDCCPVCNINLGCAPVEKLRPDHNLQDVRAKLFPRKRITVQAPEAATPIMPPAKRKERSLSSLVERSPQVTLTGRRSKSVSRKASRGFTIEKPVIENTLEDHRESSSSQEMLNKFTQNMKQNFAAGGSCSRPSTDKGRESHSGHWQEKVDLWKPLTCLVEAANGSKSEERHYDNEGLVSKTKNNEHKKKAKAKDEKNCRDHTPPESEKPKKMRKFRQKARNFGEVRVSPQVVLDAASAKPDRRNYPIWFSLVASDEVEGDAPPLPQISASYLRIKDGSMPVSFIQKYLKRKLDLPSEVEVEIRCMGQKVIPTLTLNNLVDLWLQTTSTERVSVTVGSSGKDFVMVLNYACRVREY